MPTAGATAGLTSMGAVQAGVVVSGLTHVPQVIGQATLIGALHVGMPAAKQPYGAGCMNVARYLKSSHTQAFVFACNVHDFYY